MKKRLLSLLLVLLCLFLSACGDGSSGEGDVSPSPSQEVPPSPVQTPEPTPTPEPEPEPSSPLTGLPMEEEQAAARPVAILLNNLAAALPQQGNSGADIIYEVVAEGGITRMVGIYQSLEGVETIGSVRSARPYFVELAMGHDALLIHAGGSDDAYTAMKRWETDHLDGVNGHYAAAGVGLFWRDRERIAGKRYAVEHSLVTSGEAVRTVLDGSSFRLTHPEGYDGGLTFAPDGTPAGGESAQTITVSFSGYKSSLFRYDAASGLYLAEQYGEAYIDGNTGGQIAVTNVLVLQTDITDSGDSYGHVGVALSGGTGWFACGGRSIPITWAKDGPDSPLTYTLEDGSPLALGQGKSYVCIVALSRTVTLE